MIWRFKPKTPDEFIKQFPEYSPTVLQLLWNRGLKDQRSIDEFFNPDYEEDLHDPFLLFGMKQAVKRIQTAIKKQEKIVIFGDYDADGVCGTVVLKTVLEQLGANLGETRIPNRLTEGYGLNLEEVKKIAKEKVKLIITIDCGISDNQEIVLANSLGLEVIVVDHHQIGKKLPPAKVIIDPFQKKDKYPFKQLAGAGLAFKLAQALRQVQGKLSSDKKNLEGWEKWLLDLVAIATVADLVPLLGENRTLVRYGLIVLAQTRRVGLQELMKISRLNPVFEMENLKTNLDAYSLGFILAPRLNAAGRIEHANLAFELLSTEDRERAKILAQKIDAHNKMRQKITDAIVVQIGEMIKDKLSDKNYPVIVEGDKDWSPGVVGLVASKVAERWRHPAVIFSLKQGVSRGSARSIPAFNIIEAIRACSEILEECGGHPMSAGASLATEKIPLFREKINQFARTRLKDEDLLPSLEIDFEIKPSDINWELFDDISKFEPFGKNNEPPIFLVKDMEIINCRLVGNGSQHLKLELGSDKLENKVFKAIGFRLANGNGHLQVGDKVDLVFELIIDEWNGERDLQMRIIDLKKS